VTRAGDKNHVHKSPVISYPVKVLIMFFFLDRLSVILNLEKGIHFTQAVLVCA